MSNLSIKNIVDAGLCIGCGSCAAQHNHDLEMRFDAYGQLKPFGKKSFLADATGRINHTCPFSPEAKNENELSATLFPNSKNKSELIGSFQTAYVGYAAEDDFRLNGSSGGMVSWVATELLRKGLIDGVAHVIATDDPQKEGKYFKYRISRTENEIHEGAKSRYYPVELSEVLKLIKEIPGKYAVVGIPCFIKAVQLLRNEDAIFKERIKYTLGLFCGHMKSARFIESFAWQMNVPVNEIAKVEFRYKDANRPANWYNAMLTLKDGTVVNKDWWHLADGDWGAGYFMNAACNFCDDVVSETADISFGDAWVEPYSSDGKGTNVVVVRSAEVEQIINAAIAERRLQLNEVNAAFVEQTQAAGFRQRREGLSYRLAWKKNRIPPKKRVEADKISPTKQRKFVYQIRYYISKWSHRMFFVAKKINQPQLYIRWAKAAAALYHGLAYQRGKIGKIAKKLGLH